jgi:uncharacterized Fe-S center protein
MHSRIKPRISSKCTACGECIKHCDAKAIKIENGKAKINNELCIGCAMCISVCPIGAASIPWESETPAGIQKKIALYTKATLSLFPNAIFINILEKITKICDCYGIVQEPIMKDVGIVCSSDIIAVEKASLDLANKALNGKFSKINSVDKDEQIDVAKKLGLGSREYELISV